MRCTLSIVFLLCLTWTQVSVAACALLAPATDADVTHTHLADHSHHQAASETHHPEPSPPSNDAEHHPGGECWMMAVCGATVVALAVDRPLAIGSLPDISVGLPVDRYTSPYLSSDPPPPRLPA